MVFFSLLGPVLESATRDFPKENIVGRRFGVAKALAEMYFEKAFAEERDKVERSCPILWPRNFVIEN